MISASAKIFWILTQCLRCGARRLVSGAGAAPGCGVGQRKMGAQQCIAASEKSGRFDELFFEAILRWQQAVDDRRRKVLFLGTTGSGKTTLMDAMLYRMKRWVCTTTPHTYTPESLFGGVFGGC